MAEKKRLSVEYSALSLNNSVEIVNYLKRRFTQKEVDNFFDTLKEFEMLIGIFPTLYSKSVKVKIRRAVLSKVLSVYYSVKKDRIIIVAILDNRWDESEKIIK